MKKNKLILFDWGNIVESHKTGYTIYNAFEDLFKELGYNGGNVFYKLGKYNLSIIPTLEDFEKTYNYIKKDFNLLGDLQQFIDRYLYFTDKISYYKDVRDFEVSLKEKCYIGILSNLVFLDKKRLNDQVGLDNYDYIFLSFEMECKKPNIDIYEKVQEQLSFDKQDILFIDDRKDNIETAKNFGWNGLQATGLELDKIIKECEVFLGE